MSFVIKLAKELVYAFVYFPYRWFLLLAPGWLGYKLCEVLGVLQLLVAPHRKKEQWIANVRSILGDSLTRGECLRVLREYYTTGHKNFVDLVRASRATKEGLRRAISEIEGREHLEAALAEGRGVVAVSAHLGSFKLLVTLLAAEGYDITLFMRALPAYLQQHGRWIIPGLLPAIERARATLEGVAGEKMLKYDPADGGSLAQLKMMYEHLSENEMLVFSNDRTLGKEYVETPFCEGSLNIAQFAYRLAANKGIPIVPLFIVREKDNRHRIRFEQPIILQRPEREAMRQTNLACAGLLEDQVRRHPGQWRVWPHIHVDVQTQIQTKERAMAAVS